MVNVCCVKGCKSRSDCNKDLAFYHITKNSELRKKWLKGIKQPNLVVHDSTRICSAHFPNHRKTSDTDIPSKKHTRPRPLPQQSVPRRVVRRLDRRAEEIEQLIQECESTLPVAKRPCLQDEPVFCPVPKLSDLCFQAIRNADIGMQIELRRKQHEIESLRNELKSIKFCAERFTGNDAKIHFYTGFTSWELFMAFYEMLPGKDNLQYHAYERVSFDGEKRGRKRSLTPLNEFFATMIRLRLGLLEQDLAERFQVAISTMSNILITWITYLHRVLVEFNWWPSREKVQALMPPEFQEKDEFKRTRVVLDATEIFIEKLSDLQNQTVTWSNYKSHNTLKGLVGIAPFGGVTFVSPLYTGSISDKELTLESGLLDLVEGDDNIMADRGFILEEEAMERNVTMTVPPFTRGKSQFASSELHQTKDIARLRIHVERAIERIKNYRILMGVLAASLIPLASMIFSVCAYMSNFNDPLLIPTAFRVTCPSLDPVLPPTLHK